MNWQSAIPWQGSARETWTRIAHESLYSPGAILSRDMDLLARVPYQFRSPRMLQFVARGQTGHSNMLIGVKMLYAKLRKVIITFVLSVCLSVLRMEHLGSYWTDFREILVLENCSKVCRENPSFMKM